MTPAELPVTHRFLQLPGLKVHLVEAGQGPVVLLLHGFPETWWSWRCQVAPLVEAGFRVVAPDLRGYGETEKHGPYDLDTVAADVAALVGALGETRVRVVGHDWGGAVAWHVASRRPEVCERLTVLNCPHPAVLRQALVGRPRKWAQVRRSWYMFLFQLPWLAEWLLTTNDAGNVARTLKASVRVRDHFSDAELRPFRDAILQPGAAKAMVDWYRTALRDGFNPFRTPDDYPVIRAPAQLIWGLADPALGFHDVVPGTERYAANLRVEPVEGAGHFVHAERPDVVNTLLTRFLQEHPS